LRRLDEKEVDGRKLELYQSNLGKFWALAPEEWFIAFLVWEIGTQRAYDDGPVAVQPGDTVIDCGAHVGVFTRYALRRGAGRVVAIEPDPTSLSCLKANFAQEIQEGRVVVVEAGVWDKETRGTLSESPKNSGANSFVVENPGDHKIGGLLLLPLDEIVNRFKLDRVDFIKMDIEGAEPFALRGGVRTLKRFKPRMAIASYHVIEEPRVVSKVVREEVPTYAIHAKDVELNKGRMTTKILFFH
jgi:FkbM family methyltransferase